MILCIYISSTNPLLPLYSISVVWYGFNGVFVTLILGLLGTLIFGRIHFIHLECELKDLGSNDPNTVDKSLLISWKVLFCGKRSNKVYLIFCSFFKFIDFVEIYTIGNR